jgi:DNA-3-methyladenine glycosylase I
MTTSRAGKVVKKHVKAVPAKIEDGLIRCRWVSSSDLYQKYHDQEWGNPQRDPLKLFELLCLEGAQAGLSWITILKKRESYRKAFDNFDPVKIAAYNDGKIQDLLKDPGIVRNRAKVNAIIANAQQYLELSKQERFDEFLWKFVGNSPIVNDWTGQTCPAQTKESQNMSKALKSLGFKFVGPTICYAFMQACGMVDDHDSECWKRQSNPGHANSTSDLAKLD